MNTLDAAFAVAHDYPGGADALGVRMGKRPGVLGNELRSAGAAKLGLIDAEKMTFLSRDLRILSSFATNCGQMLVPLPTVQPGDDSEIMLTLAKTAKDFGGLCEEVATDMRARSITDNMLRRIDTDCAQLIADLHALREELGRRNESGKPTASA